MGWGALGDAWDEGENGTTGTMHRNNKQLVERLISFLL
jgi:hypothetical protein